MIARYLVVILKSNSETDKSSSGNHVIEKTPNRKDANTHYREEGQLTQHYRENHLTHTLSGRTHTHTQYDLVFL